MKGLRRPWVGRYLAALIGAAQLFVSSAAMAHETEPAIAGRYYLTGVMEVGSQLQLSPDGSFQWMLAYGAVDQAAEGSWTVDGRTITLTARQQSAKDVRLRIGERADWGERASQFLQQRFERDAQAARSQSCPLRSLSRDPAADNEASVEFGDTAPALSQIAQQQSATEHDRQRAQTALDRLKSGTAWQSDTDLLEDTDLAVERYLTSAAMLRGMQVLAKIPAPHPPSLNLPAGCELADWKTEATAFRGVAIHVFDPVHHQSGDGIEVEARYDKGPVRTMVVEEGYAFFPIAKGQRIVALALHVPGAPDDENSMLPVMLDRPSVQLVDGDLGAVANAPFAQMTLALDTDGSLKPLSGPLARGVYRRAVAVPPSSGGGLLPASLSSPGDDAAPCRQDALQMQLSRAINRLVEYPPEASMQEIGGTVKIALNIARDGQVEAVDLAVSSGSPALDQAALAAARKVKSLPVPDCVFTGGRFILPVRFHVVS